LLTSRMLQWLKPGGCFFFRESCFRPSGNMKRTTNPTHYRAPTDYNELITNVCNNLSETKKLGFELIWSKQVLAYIKLKNNENQICWLMKSVERDNRGHSGFQTFQQFLDRKRYSNEAISCYQQIHGNGFIDSGNPRTNKKLSSLLNLRKNMKVLDVGCGIGGNSFFIAKEFDANVTAIDLSMNLIDSARKKKKGSKLDKLTFHVADVTKMEYPENNFDVIYSRDTIFYTKEKNKMLKDFFKWLKPDGKVLIIDYCCTSEDDHVTTAADVATEEDNFYMISLASYKKLLETTGFRTVTSMDITQELMQSLQSDLNRNKSASSTSNANIIEKMNTDLEKLLKKCMIGKMKWGLFLASK